MKKILFSLLCMLAATSYAETAVCLYPKVGGKIVLLFKDNPKITSNEKEVTMSAEKNSVTFSFTDIGKFLIEDMPEQTTKNITITKWEYSTYSSEDNTDFSESGVSAYVATSTNGTTVYLKKVTKLPAGNGALLFAKGGGEYTVSIDVDDCDDVPTNYFVAVATPVTIGSTSEDGYSNCILTLDKATQSNIGFYQLGEDQTATIPAGKSYLSVPLNNVNTLSSINFIILDEDMTNADELFMDLQTGNVFTNAAGIRSTKPTKGINITENGKKVIK